MNTATQPLTAAVPGGSVTQERSTRSRQSSSRIIGALFLIGFLTYGTGALITSSVLHPGDVMGSVSAHQTVFILGGVLMLTVAAVDIGKAVLFFPLLGAQGRRTGHTYLAAMILEVSLMAGGVIALLSLVPLSDHVQSGATDASLGQSLGTLAVDVNDLAYQTGQATVAVGAFVLCTFLYRSRLIPPGLALWGAIGYGLHLTGAVAELFGQNISMFLLIPGGVFEVAFAVWLIVRGIESRTTTSQQRDPR